MFHALGGVIRTFICNYRTGKFEETDGSGFRDWFNGQANITYGNLKPAVRLLKQIRQEKDNFEIPSVTFTALAGKTVTGNGDGVNFRNIPHALRTTSNRMSKFLNDNRVVPELSNPAFSLEKLTRNWEQDDYNNFREKFLIYNEHINSAYAESDPSRSIQKMAGLVRRQFRALGPCWSRKALVSQIIWRLMGDFPFPLSLSEGHPLVVRQAHHERTSGLAINPIAMTY